MSQERHAVAKGLRVEGLVKHFGDVPAVRGVTLTVEPGTMTSLVGPSGCGKTTTLRMIAGLEQADAGSIRAGERVLTEGRRSTPPEARDMGMVFQSYALWPHLTVFENVAYGLRRRGYAREAIAAKVDSVLAIVDMAAFAARYPGQLSGGQQQRVALARSIATEPSILLFDEPLSNLDAVLREQMRFEIRSLQQRIGITGVYVTHSQDEALVLSDRIAVMHEGRIVQHGAPMDVYTLPQTEFVATFIGLANILELSDVEHRGKVLHGRLRNGLGIVAGAGAVASAAGTTKVCVRPPDVRLVRGNVRDAENQLPGKVAAVSFTGGLVDYFVDLPGEPALRLRAQTTPPLVAQQGDDVLVVFADERTVVLES